MKNNFLMVMLIDSGSLVEVTSSYSMGSAYICSSLKHAGVNVKKFLFSSTTESYLRELQNIIEMEDISIIAMGGVVALWGTIKEIMNAAKQIRPNIVSIIGGSLVTYSPVETMQLIESADIGVIGEGEITTVEICHALEQNSDISNINGIIYRKHGEPNGLKQSNKRSEISDLNSLPFPDYSDELGEKIREWRAASLVSARSCPFSCTYCSHSGGKKYRQRSLDSIFSELDWLVKDFNVNSIRLSDELFAEQPQRINEFCDRIKPYNIGWGVSLRISRFLSLELFQKMKSSGCLAVHFGIESADDNVLKSMRKGITIAETERVLENVTEAKLSSNGMFILGDVVEDWNTIHNTVSWIEAHLSILSQVVTMTPIRLYPGSKLYDIAVADKKIVPLEHIRNGCMPVNVSKLSDRDYKYLLEVFVPREQERLRRLQARALKVEWRSDKAHSLYCVRVCCQICGYVDKQSLPIEEAFYPKTLDTLNNICKCGVRMHIGAGFNRYYSLWISDLLISFVKSKRCAFWGAGKNLKDFYDDVPLLGEIEHVIVDTDTLKHGQLICGKIVMPISIISKENTDAIIITYSCKNIEIEKQNVLNTITGINVYHLFEIGLWKE